MQLNRGGKDINSCLDAQEVEILGQLAPPTQTFYAYVQSKVYWRPSGLWHRVIVTKYWTNSGEPGKDWACRSVEGAADTQRNLKFIPPYSAPFSNASTAPDADHTTPWPSETSLRYSNEEMRLVTRDDVDEQRWWVPRAGEMHQLISCFHITKDVPGCGCKLWRHFHQEEELRGRNQLRCAPGLLLNASNSMWWYGTRKEYDDRWRSETCNHSQPPWYEHEVRARQIRRGRRSNSTPHSYLATIHRNQ